MSRDPLEPFLAAPGAAGVFLDFDGTLSEIAHRPGEARPVQGAAELLAKLGRSFGLVAVVSGRSAHQLLDWLGPDIEIWGVHGAERSIGGRVELTEAAAPYAGLMDEVRREAEERVRDLGLEGVLIEDKGVMVGLHFRAATDPKARETVDEMAAEMASRHGLKRAGGRLAFELRPPLDFTKEAVVRRRVIEKGLSAAMFVGDDLVDLPAWDALDDFAAAGLSVLRVGVSSDEVPAELLERADVLVDGPQGVLAFLERLVPAD
ncbi:trehalose-phosphatase [soil metagenome]